LADLNATLEQRVQEGTSQWKRRGAAAKPQDGSDRAPRGIARDFNNLLQGILGALNGQADRRGRIGVSSVS
jgi:hypothetical protein